MKVIQNNVVENYLKKYPNKKLSLRKLQKYIKLSRRHIYFLAINSKKIRKIHPIEVGSYRHKLSVFTYNDVPDVISNVDMSHFDELEDNIID
jgi:hypothetical protein